MGSIKSILLGGVAGIIAMGAMTAPVLAWHPEGKITKKVQNMTGGGQLVDANDEKTAVAAKPGDILTYVITISNAQTNDDGKNDMANTVMTDTLPEGVELVANPGQRTITENVGTIKPKQSITKQYEVKVTATAHGKVITNKACFSGNSSVNDNPQSGCEAAVVTVSNSAPEPPKPAPTAPAATTSPQQPPQATPATTPAAPETKDGEPLPQTGPASTILITALAVIGGYILYLKRFARQN